MEKETTNRYIFIANLLEIIKSLLTFNLIYLYNPEIKFILGILLFFILRTILEIIMNSIMFIILGQDEFMNGYKKVKINVGSLLSHIILISYCTYLSL